MEQTNFENAVDKLIDFQNTYELTGKIEDVILADEVRFWCRINKTSYVYFTQALNQYGISNNITIKKGISTIRVGMCGRRESKTIWIGIKKKVLNAV